LTIETKLSYIYEFLKRIFPTIIETQTLIKQFKCVKLWVNFYCMCWFYLFFNGSCMWI